MKLFNICLFQITYFLAIFSVTFGTSISYIPEINPYAPSTSQSSGRISVKESAQHVYYQFLEWCGPQLLHYQKSQDSCLKTSEDRFLITTVKERILFYNKSQKLAVNCPMRTVCLNCRDVLVDQTMLSIKLEKGTFKIDWIHKDCFSTEVTRDLKNSILQCNS